MIKKNSILLVNASPWGIEPPIAIYTLKDYLTQFNISVECFDFNIKLYNIAKKEYAHYWDMQEFKEWLPSKNNNYETDFADLIYSSCEVFALQIANLNFEFIGFSLASPKEFISFELIGLIKKYNPNKKIILGGSSTCTKDGLKLINSLDEQMQEKYFLSESCIEGIFMGNSEFELKEYLLNPNIFQKGFICKAKSNLFSYDSFPKYTKEDLFLYDENIKNVTLTLEWSRGCINNCYFCNIKHFNGSFLSKSPKFRLKEIEFHYKAHGITKFSICDSLVNDHLQDLIETCKLLIKKNFKIYWTGQFMARKEMTQEIYDLIAESGCKRIELGIESCSNNVLNAMNKKITIDDIKKNLQFAKNSGIYACIYLIVGFPGETENDFQETCLFLRENAHLIDELRSIRQLYLVPGSFVADNKNKYNIIVNFNDHHAYYWKINNENTYDIRMNRVNILINLAKEIGILVSLHD